MCVVYQAQQRSVRYITRVLSQTLHGYELYTTPFNSTISWKKKSRVTLEHDRRFQLRLGMSGK